MKKRTKKDNGQMLIEIVVAVGIIAMVLVGVSDLMTRSSRVVSYQREKDAAVRIAQKILNDYGSERDTDPDSFYANVASETITPCEAGSHFTCVVEVDKGEDLVQFKVTVKWDDGGQEFSTSLDRTLSKTIK